MRTVLNTAIAACIVLSVVSMRSTTAGHFEADLRLVATPEVILVREMRHPSAREYVSGPWPRFVKKMLA